jgi:hypothetical protein
MNESMKSDEVEIVIKDSQQRTAQGRVYSMLNFTRLLKN